MKTLWNIFSIVLLVNVLVLAGIVAKLYADGRINRDRLVRTVAIFKPAIEEENRQIEQQKNVEFAALHEQNEQTWRQNVMDGPVSVESKIQDDIERREQWEQLLIRLKKDRKALLDAMSSHRVQIEQLQAQLKQQRDRFEQRMAEDARRLKSQGFARAVQMYERAEPAQVKKMFTKLINTAPAGHDQVVQYLSTMQPRKAADVLGEFTSDQEITVATGLIEALRRRGIDLLDADPAQAGGAS
jgi:hypothetical protein